jgi:hypothetical protein
MESKVSLQCWQQPVTGSYSEPDESNPHPPTLFPKSNFNIIIPSNPRSSGGLQVIQPKFCMRFLFPRVR